MTRAGEFALRFVSVFVAAKDVSRPLISRIVVIMKEIVPIKRKMKEIVNRHLFSAWPRTKS